MKHIRVVGVNTGSSYPRGYTAATHEGMGEDR